MNSGAPTASELPVAAAIKAPTAPVAGSQLAMRLRANSEYVAIPRSRC